MSKVEFFVTPGYGERNLEKFHYSQAVKYGNRVEISGQGGWNDDWEFPESVEEEVIQAFENVERTLALAGASWKDVVHVNSYHVPTAPDFVGDEHLSTMTDQFRKRMGSRAPVWTTIGVPSLGDQRCVWKYALRQSSKMTLKRFVRARTRRSRSGPDLRAPLSRSLRFARRLSVTGHWSSQRN